MLHSIIVSSLFVVFRCLSQAVWQCFCVVVYSVAACLVCIGWAEHKVVIPANFTF